MIGPQLSFAGEEVAAEKLRHPVERLPSNQTVCVEDMDRKVLPAEIMLRIHAIRHQRLRQDGQQDQGSDDHGDGNGSIGKTHENLPPITQKTGFEKP